MAGYLALEGVLGGLLDPDWLFGEQMVPIFLGTALGIGSLLTATSAVSILRLRHAGSDWRFRIIPEALPIAISCVAISRATGYQPGYLYGLVAGVVAHRAATSIEHDERDEAASATTGVLALLAIGLVAWLSFALTSLPAGAPAPTGLELVARTALATIVLSSIQGAAFSLVPIRFFAGALILRSGRGIWSLLAVMAIGLFVLLLMQGPDLGYPVATSSVVAAAILLGLFGGGSVAFWAAFRGDRAPAAEPAEA